MNKIFLPAIFATALALTSCGKKEEQAADDAAPAAEEHTTTGTTEMHDLTAPAEDHTAADHSETPSEDTEAK